jgi:hypothetical protein
MSSQNEEILVEEPMVVNGVAVNGVEVAVKAKKPKAKGFAARDKKVMYSILGFMILLKEKGLVDEEKAIELMEALPLYQTAAEKTAFFAQDVFDTKRVENEIYKPMVAEHKKSKKAKRSRKPKAVEGKNTTVETPTESEKKETNTETKEVEVEAAPKEKKPRAKKNKTEGEGEENKQKRGRKAKQQIVELQQVSSESVPKEDQLDQLINTMGVEPEDINVEDIDSMLQEMESEAKPEPVAEPVSEPKKKPKAKKVVEKEPGEIIEKPKKVKKAKAVTIAEDAKPN